MNEEKIVFGPVPSRRLGKSLGINNIFPKVCSYSCVYCQIGRTQNKEIERRAFYPPEKIEEQVKKILKKLKKKKEKVDYLSFVPNGEPTLDVNLGEEIEKLKIFGIKIAVITNSSLLWKEDVRKDIMKADWVSLKIDTVNENVWKKINRPYKGINFKKLLEGIKIFSSQFKGFLTTETMIIKKVNDTKKEFFEIGKFLKEISPDKVYIGIPIRPPAEKWVLFPSEKKLTDFYIICKNFSLNVEFLTGYKQPISFGFTGDIKRDIIAITSVHPMSKKQIIEFLKKANANWNIVEQLIQTKKIKEIRYQGEKYYLKKL